MSLTNLLHDSVPRQQNSPRRALRRKEAADYAGISATFFDELVKNGQMPKPAHIGKRTVWDIRQLDEALDNVFGEDVNRWEMTLGETGAKW
jgi:predicted DNA-binding transcriptional regulator AlpA